MTKILGMMTKILAISGKDKIKIKINSSHKTNKIKLHLINVANYKSIKLSPIVCYQLYSLNIWKLSFSNMYISAIS